MTIESRLAEIRARCDAVTDGPWEDVVDDLNDDVDVWRDGESRLWVANTGEVFTASAQRARQILADAEFIAASRTDLPTLLAAVEAVMARHSAEPARYYGTDLNPSNPYDCRACGEGRAWPCPTVRDITAALDANTTAREDKS